MRSSDIKGVMGFTSNPVADAANFDDYQDSITEQIVTIRDELYSRDSDILEALREITWEDPRDFSEIFRALRSKNYEKFGRLIKDKLDEQITLNAQTIRNSK